MVILKIAFLIFTIFYGLHTLIRALVHFDLLHVAEPEPFPFVELIFQILLCLICFLLLRK